MAMRGERFELDLDPEDAYLGSQGQALPEQQPRQSLGLDFVKDVLERESATTRLPEPPKFKQSPTGFPAHKKRDGKSRFKQRRDGTTATSSSPARAAEVQNPGRSSQQSSYLNNIASATADEKASIDRETTQMIETMTPAEIAQARSELLSDSTVSMMQRLIRRSRIDEPDDASPAEPAFASAEPRSVSSENNGQATAKKKVSFAEPAKPVESEQILSEPPAGETKEDIPPPSLAAALNATQRPLPSEAASNATASQQVEAARDPARGKPDLTRALDPNSDNFLSDLHSTYFPDLPSDPNQLAWMAPVPEDRGADSGSSSQDDSTSAASSGLRFDFDGRIVSKARSAVIPVTKGLHHHGNDPGSAGYTIDELAIYARSTIAAQRCFAYQLLGRVLFRLGKGEYGPEDGPRAQGLYDEFRKGYILDQLLKEASRDPGTGNESARVWALEAVWLWRRGGGKGLDDVEVEEERDESGHDIMGDAAASILEQGLNY